MRAVAIALVVTASLASTGISTADAQLNELIPRAVIGGIASDRDLHPVEVQLEGAQKYWAQAGITDYAMTVAMTRYGPTERHHLTVKDGLLVDAESECFLGGEPLDCDELEFDVEQYTVEGLFALVRQRLWITPVTPPSLDDRPGTPFLEADFAYPAGLPVRILYGLDRVFDSDTGITIERFSLPAADQDLAFARARWAVNAWFEYATAAQWFDHLAGDVESRSVHVRDGVIIDSATECSAGDGGELAPCPLDPGAEQATVEGMFAFVESLLAMEELDVNVTYNVVDGHVQRVSWGARGAPEEERDSVQVVRFDTLG